MLLGADLQRRPPLRVLMLGLRAVAGAQGGIETHVRDIVRGMLAAHADEVAIEVIERRPHVRADRVLDGPLAQATLTALWSPRSTGLETIVHTLLGVLYAGWRRPDVLHLHGVGPALMTPLARLLGLRVVVTHHGEDYAREKWGAFARWVLETGERMAARFATAGIVIAEPLVALMHTKYRRGFHFIPNAAPETARRTEATDQLDRWQLQRGRYFVHVGRIVPEKRQLDLIHAFAQCPDPELRLVLVGGNDHPNDYEKQVAAAAARDARVVRTGVQGAAVIYQLLSHARAFVLPSTHEGLPISLLEAMQCGCPVIASDIVSLLALRLPPECYVRCGEVSALAAALQVCRTPGDDGPPLVDWQPWLARYALPAISAQTVAVYRFASRRQ